MCIRDSFQIGGIEALGEPAVDGSEEIGGFSPPTLLAPQPGQVRDSAQFQRFRLLRLRDANRLVQAGLTLVEPVICHHHNPGKAV